MAELKHREIQELLGAYALDAVEQDEADAVERHLAICPRCRAEVAGLRETAALLAHAGQEAPPQLWDRISASLEEAPPALRLVSGSDTAASTRRWSRIASVAAIAAVLATVLASVAGLRVLDQERRLDALQTAVRSDPLRDAANAALADPSAQRVVLRSTDGRNAATVVTTAAGDGYLVRHDLPALPQERIYQLWALVGEAKVSAAVVAQDARVVAFRAPGAIDGFAITEEDAPGAPAPTRTPIVVGFVRTA